MEAPDLRLLAGAYSRPQLNVLELPSGQFAPSPVPVDNTVTTLKSCVVRDGWLAIDAGEEVWAAPLPLRGRAWKVGASFTCVPGINRRTVWIQGDMGDHRQVVEYDGAARSIVREVTFPREAVLHAETPLGLVARDWEGRGEVRLYDYAGAEADGVLADAEVVDSHRSVLLLGPRSGNADRTLLDVETGREVTVSCPAGAAWSTFGTGFSPDGSQLAVTLNEDHRSGHEQARQHFEEVYQELAAQLHGIELFDELERRAPGWRTLVTVEPESRRLAIVRCADGETNLLDGPIEGFVSEITWSADGQSLVFTTPSNDRGLWLWQTGANSLERITFERTTPSPLLDVGDESMFGDLSVSKLRALQRPAWRGPIPADQRERMLATSRETVHDAAEEAGLPAAALADSREAIRLRSCVAGRNVPVGASRLGGRPDLPNGYRWPRYEGEPMAFLAQLRMEELRAALPSAPLPEQGLLVVFAAVEPDGTYVPEEDCVHVAIVPETGLKRRSWPENLDPDLRYEHALAVAEPMVAPPSRSALLSHADESTIERFIELNATSGPLHQLFGHANTIQEIRPPDGYQLLLQFDEDANLGSEFGDGGRIYVWSRTERQADSDFADCLIDDDSY